MAGFADTVAARWREPDAGIWEIRGDVVHHVHSKLMAWLALDRALRITEHHRLSGRRRRRWSAERDALAADISARGFDGQRNTFTRHYGSSGVDAALLVLPLLGIEPAGSPRVRGRHRRGVPVLLVLVGAGLGPHRAGGRGVRAVR